MRGVAPMGDGVPNQQVEECIVRAGNGAAQIGLILLTGYEEGGLIEEFFRESSEHASVLTHETQVRMQSDVFGMNDANNI